MESYAFNYKPQKQVFGRQFYYDGIHDFEYWELNHPGVDYKEYWSIRNAFVERNFNIVESLTNDISNAPIKDIANFTAGISDDLRITQTISSKKAWESVRDITNGTGTVMSIDLETIGDITTKHVNVNGQNIINDYSGITEIGFHFRNYIDGVMQPDNQTFTLVLGLDSKRYKSANDVVLKYVKNGYDALNGQEQRLIQSLSTYGGNFNDVFKQITISGETFYALQEKAEHAIPDISNAGKVRHGLENLRVLYNRNDAIYEKELSKIKNYVINTINNGLNDKSTVIISANSAFEASALSDWGLDGKKFMNNSADLIYANTTIARANNISVYDMQKNAILSHNVTGNNPASVQNSAYAAGLDITEKHHGGGDAKIQVDIGTNKLFTNDKSYAENVLDASDKLQNMPTIDYDKSYFYLRNGQLDKNKLDHAVVDGKPTQSYSIRGRFYKIDKEHSNYVMIPKQIPDPNKVGEYMLSEPERVYVLSLIDDEGNRVSKQFQTEQEGLTFLTQNSSIMSTNYEKRRKNIRNTHTINTEMDWGRRIFDGFFNPNDTRHNNKINTETKFLEEINGFSDLKKYLDIVNDIDKQRETGKAFKEVVTAEYLDSFGIKGNYQQTAFIYTYRKIKSEENALKEIVNYIDANMPDANNLQKTVALRDIRKAYIDYVQNDLGYIPYSIKTNKNENITLITDALGIDIKVGEEYKRIHGDSINTIQKDLDRIFKGQYQDDIVKSLKELQERQVLSEDATNSLIKRITNTTAPRNTYYNTVFADIAIELNNILEPISNYESPIAFFNNLDNKDLTNAQKIAIKNKLQNPTIYDTVHLLSKTQFVKNIKDKHPISLSNIKEKPQDILNLINANDIVNTSKSVTFTEDVSKTLYVLGEKLGYSSHEIDILEQMFIPGVSEKSKKYAILSEDRNLQSFIVNPSDKNTSAFVLVTNEKHSSKVADMLSNGAIEKYISDNNLDYLSKNDIAKIFKDNASVIELKKINRTNIMTSFSDLYGDGGKYIAELFGGNITPQMSTINQSQNLEKFVIPSMNIYRDNETKLISGNLLEAGESYLTSYRMTGEPFLDAVENDNFDTANYLISKNQNKSSKELASPSSYRGYDRKRVPNYNYNDISHGFYFDAKGLKETFKLQIQDAINNDNIESPLYKIVETIGLINGDLREDKISEKISISLANNIVDSIGFNEFFAKNILTGKVADDNIIAERLSSFSNIKREAFNKNILGIMIDEMEASPKSYAKGFIDMFKKIQKASPYMTQILNETNTHNLIFSFLKPGDIINLGLINSPMRPTYGQILNAIRFDHSTLNKNIMSELEKGDVIVGPVSRTKAEQFILDTFGNIFEAPSGKKYAEEERIVMSPFKQMNDVELVLRYKKLDEIISDFAISDIDKEKLEYAYNIFKREHMSLYEGKWFGAPMLLNQYPFSSSDIKKVKIKILQNHKDRDKLYKSIQEEWTSSIWDENKQDFVPHKKITQGDTLVEIKGHRLLWEGPDTYLTKENIDELFEAGETNVIPSNRMVSDIKMMAQQEKATVHFTLIDDEFMKKHGHMFESQEEALKYMQRAFDAVSGYNPEIGYRPMLIGNLSSYKHGTAISLDSTFGVIVHEYEKRGKINTLIDKLREIEYFKNWNFDKKISNGRAILLSNQINKKGAEEAINQLYDNIMNSDTEIDKHIQKVFKSLNEDSIAYLETQRMLNNEIMGSKVMMDERMMQSIRLRAIERPYQEGKSFEDLYIDTLKNNARNHYYEHGSMVKAYKDKNLYALHSAMDELAEDSINASKMRAFSKNISSQEKILYAINDSLMYYVNGIDIDESNVFKIDINDVLKNLPEKNITRNNIEDLIFYKDGEPSNLLKELAGNKNINAKSIYLDFGTSIKASYKLKGTRETFSGILIPIFDTHVDSIKNELFLTQSQKELTTFFNIYKKNIGKIDGEKEITEAIDNLYSSFVREMNPYDKNSLASKTAGKILLPHSAQSLAQDEVAPIVDAMFDDNYIKQLMGDEYTESISELIEKEKQIRSAVISGDFSKVKDIDNIIEKRSKILSKISEQITNGEQVDSLFNLTQLSLINEQYKGYEIIDNEKYFANAFEMNAKNLKRHGVDTGLVGYQIFEDAFYMRDIGEIYQGDGTLVKFESNAKFDKFLKDGEGIQQQILDNLKEQGLEFDDGKQLLRQLNEAITKDMSRGERSEFATKVYKSMSFLGEQYLRDVGIIAREVWRPPIFSAQVPGRIFLNNDIGNNQIRALTGGITSIINNVDFDGDMYMLSLSLNANGGLRTMLEDDSLRKSYIESLKANNGIMAKLIKEGVAFKKDSLNDIAYYRLEQLKAFDAQEYENGLKNWIKNNDINITKLEDLAESQKIMAAHSKELRNAYATFSSKGSMITNDDIIKAAIAARVRKDNIGSISTPNYKVRNSLFILKNGIVKDGTLSKAEKKAAFDILQDITGIDSSKLLDITEQKSIDVKHIFDAVNIAETPKWAKGMSMLFDNQKEEGLRLMLTAVNNSTFTFKGKDTKETEAKLNKILNKILNTDRDKLREEINKNKKILNKLSFNSKEYNALNKQISQQEFILQFKALYDATDISHAKEVHKYILRNKNASTREFAEEIVDINKLKKAGLFKDSAEGDLIELINKTALDSKFKGNENYLYFLPGSLRDKQDIENAAYIIKEIEESNVILEKVNIDGAKLIKTGELKRLSEKNTNYMNLNKSLDNYIGINAYQYINGLSREGIDLEVSRRKIANTMTDMILEKDNKVFNAFFNKMGKNARLKYGINEYDFIGPGFNKTTIEKTRELLKDYKYYINDNQLDNAPGVRALIRDINKAIADTYNPDMLLTTMSDYDELVRGYITSSIDGVIISSEGLQKAHEKRKALGKFNLEEYIKQKNFLDEKLYDIIISEEKLNESFDTLTDIYNKAVDAKIDLPNDLKDVIANKDKTISDTLNNIRSLNEQTIRETQDNIYKLFKDSNQMDIVFKWNQSIASNETIVGFGEYLGKNFGELNNKNIESILSASVSGATDKEKYAIQTTQTLLKQYKDTHNIPEVEGIVRKNIHDSIAIITERNEQFKHSFNMDFIRNAINEAASSSNMKRKTVSGGMLDSLKNVKLPKLKTIGIVAGSLAALGIANNLLHSDKHKSPVSPEFSNDHNDPGFKNDSVMSQQIAPPSKKTIYVDKPSGFQFKVSAKTNNYINDVNNAKLIGLANGGQANVYSQQDTSGVTDNWLANKFAELT